MVSWWPGDGNADDIQDDNDGTLQNGATFASGKVGQGFSLDGVDDYVDVVDATNLKPDQLTVDAWIQGSVLPSIHYFIVAKSGSSGEFGYELGITGETDKHAAGLARFSVLTGDGQPFGDAVGLTNILDGEFHHIAGTYDGSDVKVYVDGVLEGSDSFSSPIVYTTDSLRIGVRQHIFGNVFNGLIDEVEIFNRALSEVEIQAIFDAGSAGKCHYSLNLFEDGDPSDLVYDLGQEARAVAETDDPVVTEVTFRWNNPSGDTVDIEIVPLSLTGQAESTFAPNEVGTWTVIADFGNGVVIQETLDIDFMVIPESSMGVIALLVSSLAALGGFVLLKRKQGNSQPHSLGDLGI
jgi:hypothetical protein